jgi:hypothetical protein
MLAFDVTSRYRVLCVTWILCEHWSRRGTGMGVVEKRSRLKVWFAYCDHFNVSDVRKEEYPKINTASVDNG